MVPRVADRFVDRYPRTPEAAQAMLQLALSKEFEDKEREALEYYKKVADRPSPVPTPVTKRPARCVDWSRSAEWSNWKARTIDGKPFRLSQLRGTPGRAALLGNLVRAVQAGHEAAARTPGSLPTSRLATGRREYRCHSQPGFRLLARAPLPWIQLFAKGGLEASPLAQAFGVQTLPMMLLVDDTGKLIRHNVRAAELDSELEKMLKPK